MFGIGVCTARVKTSIYADKALWESLSLKWLKGALKLVRLLRSLLRTSFLRGCLMGDVEGYEINFEPIKPKAGLVSVFVRDLRDDGANSLS
jgi:hypothetical protein